MAKFSQVVEDRVASFIDGLHSGGPRGMWIHGPRRSGTTTLARDVVNRVYDNECYDSTMSEGCLISALDLTDLQRKVWTQEELMRSNSHDMALWQETQQLVGGWESLWNANVLMIDDVISVDAEFWKRHIMPRIDQRLKGRGVTLVAGVAQPSIFGDWGVGVAHLCALIRLLGDHGEG